MFEEEIDDRFERLVPIGVEAELFEIAVFADQFFGRVRQQFRDPCEGLPAEGLLQVFDDIELRAAFAQDFQRSARLAAARIVVEPPNAP